MGRIKLGISQKSLGLPFRRSLAPAQKLGVTAIELEASGELWPQNLTQTGRREITHLLRSHDLSVSAIVCPLRRGLDDAQDLEPRLEQIRLTMALAFDLGPRLVIIQAGAIGDPGAPSPARDRLSESLDSLGHHGDRTGVTIALDTGLDKPETMTEFLHRFDAGSLGINFNPANLLISGHNPYDAVRIFNKRMAHAHAQDARRINPNRMATVPLGHGDLDWMQLLANFEEIDYRGGITVIGDNLGELAAGVTFLRRFVA